MMKGFEVGFKEAKSAGYKIIFMDMAFKILRIFKHFQQFIFEKFLSRIFVRKFLERSNNSLLRWLDNRT